ncbi:hypothetical protein ID850_00475 [Xenorhabdus sp. Flor]|uniref:hypothetical protein n=1 Tax=Xenorhabdus cabanillasii TaxID=351673 RepID=UPI0019C81297|nr:hypothetical protein [Xenorhabdus sp. Flor]MBD2813262.1 hypothetical protein [Xenorhabdus sp. Flor]
MNTLYIDNPLSSQSISIARMIKNHSNIKIIGITDKKNKIKYFDELIKNSKFNFSLIDNREKYYLPTTAKETESCLKSDSVILKNINLERNALICYDKISFLKKALSINIPTPKTYFDINEISEFPVFYKEKFEQGGGIRGIALNHSNIPIKHKENLIYQEYIKEKGTYGVAFIAKNGKLLICHSHFEKDSFPKTGGSAIYIENFSHPNLIENTRKIIKNLNYTGWGLAEFKYSKEIDNFIIMEINAKMWASCEFTLINNPNFLSMLFGINIKESKGIKSAIFLNRFFERGVIYVLKNIPLLFKADKIIIHPKLYISIIKSIIPNYIINRLKIN